MNLSDDVAAAIAAFCAEWNKAEKAIKIAEQVNGEIINPAIYELRYGARRVVEAFAAIQSGDEGIALRLLRDAHFDCSRARHDAIDAATSKMVADLDIAVKKLGAESVLAAFPDLSRLVADLGEVRDKIAVSRETRNDRDAIYQSIEKDNLEDQVRRFRAFQASEPIMKAHARGDRRERMFHRIATAVAIAVALAAWLWPRSPATIAVPPPVPDAVSTESPGQ